MKTYLNKILFLLLISCFFACNEPDKTGYVNITEVYRKIEISLFYRDYLEEMEKAMNNSIQNKEAEVKELKSKLSNKTSDQLLLKNIFQAQERIDSLEAVYSNAFKDSTIKYNKLIENKVNDLIYSFGKEKEFDYIFSPANTNAFMYADEGLEITKPIIDYINQKTQP